MSKSGRPTKQRHLKLEEKFHDCYVKGFDPLYAADLVETDKKTAYRYYEKITREITLHHKEDYFERVQENLEQIIQSYDYLLGEFYSMYNDVKKKSLSDKESNLQLTHSKITILKEIKHILSEKAQLRMDLPHHDKLEQMISEQIKRHVEAN